MTNNTLAVIADKDISLAFRSIGAEIFPCTEIKETVKNLVSREFAIILISEKQFLENKDFLDSFRAQPYPIILPIPDGVNNTGFGQTQIKQNILKAIGGLKKRGDK